MFYIENWDLYIMIFDVHGTFSFFFLTFCFCFCASG